MPNTYEILMIVDLNYDSIGSYFENIPYVVSDTNHLIKEINTDGEQTGRYLFPLTNINLLKNIAKDTVDYNVKIKQDSGYTHTTNVIYSSTERSRSMLMGKIQQIGIEGTTTNILYPDINGSPISHTKTEIEAIGTGMASYIENVFSIGAGLKMQIDDPAISDISGLESLLMNGIQSIHSL